MKNNAYKKSHKTKNAKMTIGISRNKEKNDWYYQDICYRIMEHNIWTIKPEQSYFKESLIKELESIYIGNYKNIDTNEPLLMLLSLIDTIEYIKRMSTTGLDNSNAQNRPTTIAKRISIDITENKIIIRYSKINGFEEWSKLILDLRNWVNINVTSYDKDIMIGVNE